MSVKNLARVYDKLRGGLQIMNVELQEPGTLGMIVVFGGAPYLVSAKHVLAGPRRGIGDAVRQPNGRFDIAVVDRISATLDCAAARLNAGQQFELEILNIGKLVSPVDPVEEMRVMKVGASTGATQGRVTRVEGNQVVIKPLKDFPLDYQLSEGGDSGAVWVDMDSRAPVALHFSAQSGGESIAFGIPMPAVLRELRLS